MKTEDFFSLIYGQGKRVIALKTEKGLSQKFVNNDAAAAKLVELLEAQGRTVYHGCATFQSDKSRKGDNVQEVKAFWVDLDVEKDNPKKYPSLPAAVADIAAFVKALNLPRPMLVSSGGGLHVYWILTDPITPSRWLLTAKLLKDLLKYNKVKADPTRTADVASVLRPINTTNHKYNTPVRVLKTGIPTTNAAFYTLLETYANARGLDHDVPEPDVPSYIPRDVGDTSLDGGLYAELPDANTIRASCGAVRALADSRGDLPEPAWYHAMGVVVHCMDGKDVCHEWSRGHAGYNFDQTERKIHQLLGVRPTTCKVLEDHFPDACNGCPFYGKINSPIKLGFTNSEAVDTAVVEDDESDDKREIDLNPEGMPKGFAIRKEHGVTGVCHRVVVQDEDGSVESAFWAPITDIPFWPIASIADESDKHQMRIRMLYRNLTKKRDFNIPAGIAGTGGKDLRSALADRQIVVSGSNAKHVEEYLRGWMNYQVNHVDSIRTFGRMGWHKDSFLIGRNLYMEDGTVREIVPTPNAEPYARALTPKGDLDDWIKIVDKLYNVPGREHLQFLVLCSFAAPLVKLLGSTGGLFVHSHSDQSGVGKTTAERVILSVWGHWKTLETAHGRATENAINDQLGVMGNLPVMIDELTNMKSENVSAFIHAISQGQGKNRLNRNAVRNASSDANWDTIVVGSGNTRMSDKLTAQKGNPDAELARLFEFTMPSINNAMSLAESNKLLRKLEGCTGVAGEAYIKFIVKNKAVIQSLLEKEEAALQDKYNFSANERYWYKLMVVISAAHKITKKMGLLNFDRKAVSDWVGGVLAQLRGGVVEVHGGNATEEKFSLMINDLMENMLITIGDADSRRITKMDPVPVREPKSNPVGRIVLESSNPAASAITPKCWVTTRAVKQWANSRSVSYRQLLDDWIADGTLLEENKVVNLGNGVARYVGMGASRVHIFDPKLVEDV